MKDDDLVCAECGGTNIHQAMWMDPNNFFERDGMWYYAYVQEGEAPIDDDVYCHDCEEHVATVFRDQFSPRVKLPDLVKGRRYEDMDGDVGTWDGERLLYDDGALFKPTATGAYNLHGWTEVE